MNQQAQLAYSWGEDFAHVIQGWSLLALPTLSSAGCLDEFFRAVYGNVAFDEAPTFQHKPLFETMLAFAEKQFPEHGRHSFYLGWKRFIQKGADSFVPMPAGFTVKQDIWLASTEVQTR